MAKTEKKKTEMIKIKTIKLNENNPRFIRDDKFYKLVESIRKFPRMMELRPIIIDDNNIVLGGNMRLRALQELQMIEIPENWIKKASEYTEEEKREFMIKDNVSFGEWDWDALANEFDEMMLQDFGLDVEFNAKEVDKLQEPGDEINVGASLQVEPPMEYILIMAPPNSEEFEDMKKTIGLQMVRRGGYKKGSDFDRVGLERVLTWNDFKQRIGGK